MQEILPLKLFDPKQVHLARRTQAIRRTGRLPSRQSERRGAPPGSLPEPIAPSGSVAPSASVNL